MVGRGGRGESASFDDGRRIVSTESCQVRDRLASRMRVASIVLSSVLAGAGIVALAAARDGVASAAAPAATSAPPVTLGSHKPDDHGCDGARNKRASGSLTKTTSAGPNGSSVLPGQVITVTLAWNAADVAGRSFSSVDCVWIGRHISATLSQAHTPGPSGGTDTFSYVVPNGTDGQPICDRGVLLGANGEGEGGDGSGDGLGAGGGDGTDSAQGTPNEAGRQGQQTEAAATASGQGRGFSRGDDQVERSAVFCYTIEAAVTPEAPTAVLLPVAGLLVGTGGFVYLRRRRRAGTRPST